MSSCVVLWPLIALAGWVFGNLALLGAMAAFNWWHTRRRDRLRQHPSSRASARIDDGGATKARSRGTLGEEAVNENLVAPSLVEQGTDKNVRSGSTTRRPTRMMR